VVIILMWNCSVFIDGHVVLQKRQKSCSNGVSSPQKMLDVAGDSVHLVNGYIKLKDN